MRNIFRQMLSKIKMLENMKKSRLGKPKYEKFHFIAPKAKNRIAQGEALGKKGE